MRIRIIPLKFTHDYNSTNDIQVVAQIFRQKAGEFTNAKDFEEYVQRADGIWQEILQQYKTDTGKDMKIAMKDWNGYEDHLANKSSVLLNKEIGSRKRNASFDFEKMIQKFGTEQNGTEQ